MSRYKTFDATGVAPGGRLFAGDLNAIQDRLADQANFAQTIDLATLRIGDTSIGLNKFGTAEARITAALRTDGILRGLGGLFAGTFTTTQRDAIASGFRPFGLIVLNTTTARFEWNAGSDASPSWQALAPTLGNDSITLAMMTDNSVGTNELVASAVTAAKIDGTLKPSVSAAAGTEALRALGATANTAAAGNDARLGDTRVPTDDTVTLAKINTALKGGAAAGSEALRALGATATTATAGNDARLPTANEKNAFAGTSGTAPSGANKFVDDADPRNTNTRTPTDNTVSTAKLQANSVTAAKVAADVATQAELDSEAGTRAAGDSGIYAYIASAFYLPRAGDVTPHTDGAANGHVNFAAAFPNGCVAVVTSSKQGGGIINVTGYDRFGFDFYAYLIGPGAQTDADVPFIYMAFGY